jgi:hypothetical protein
MADDYCKLKLFKSNLDVIWRTWYITGEQQILVAFSSFYSTSQLDIGDINISVLVVVSSKRWRKIMQNSLTDLEACPSVQVGVGAHESEY